MSFDSIYSNTIENDLIIGSDTCSEEKSCSEKNERIHKEGYLKIISGCMFSGKTSYLIKENRKWKSIDLKVLTINFHLDLRYGNNKIISHDNNNVECVMIKEFNDKLNKTIKNYDVIIINEAQFFSDLKKYVIPWVDELKKIVIVSGLDGDFKRNKFGEILDLIPYCDEYIKLKAFCAICKNGCEALFSLKLNDNDKLIDIGTKQYIPVCRKHYLEKSKCKSISKSKLY
jgi:thymidine kinase